MRFMRWGGSIGGICSLLKLSIDFVMKTSNKYKLFLLLLVILPCFQGCSNCCCDYPGQTLYCDLKNENTPGPDVGLPFRVDFRTSEKEFSASGFGELLIDPWELGICRTDSLWMDFFANDTLIATGRVFINNGDAECCQKKCKTSGHYPVGFSVKKHPDYHGTLIVEGH